MIEMRLALRQDRHNIFVWRNDAQTRLMPHNTEKIEWKTHCDWFDRVILDQNFLLLIASEGQGKDKDLGVVCFNYRGDHRANISLYLNPEKRGAGKAVVMLLSTESFLDSRIMRIVAQVKIGNIASVKTFQRAHYQNITSNDDQGYVFLKTLGR